MTRGWSGKLREGGRRLGVEAGVVTRAALLCPCMHYTYVEAIYVVRGKNGASRHPKKKKIGENLKVRHTHEARFSLCTTGGGRSFYLQFGAGASREVKMDESRHCGETCFVVAGKRGESFKLFFSRRRRPSGPSYSSSCDTLLAAAASNRRWCQLSSSPATPSSLESLNQLLYWTNICQICMNK